MGAGVGFFLGGGGHRHLHHFGNILEKRKKELTQGKAASTVVFQQKQRSHFSQKFSFKSSKV